VHGGREAVERTQGVVISLVYRTWNHRDTSRVPLRLETLQTVAELSPARCCLDL
jgi:hypothetical protein